MGLGGPGTETPELLWQHATQVCDLVCWDRHSAAEQPLLGSLDIYPSFESCRCSRGNPCVTGDAAVQAGTSPTAVRSGPCSGWRNKSQHVPAALTVVCPRREARRLLGEAGRASQRPHTGGALPGSETGVGAPGPQVLLPGTSPGPPGVGWCGRGTGQHVHRPVPSGRRATDPVPLSRCYSPRTPEGCEAWGPSPRRRPSRSVALWAWPLTPGGAAAVRGPAVGLAFV